MIYLIILGYDSDNKEFIIEKRKRVPPFEKLKWLKSEMRFNMTEQMSLFDVPEYETSLLFSEEEINNEQMVVWDIQLIMCI